MPRIVWLIGLLIAFAPTLAHAQPWSGVLSPSRATDWSKAGVLGGIPNRTTTCATIAPYSGSAAAINNAIAACPSGQVVQLGAGTFTLSTAIVIAKSNVTLRGAGTMSTKLVITNNTSRCGLFFNAAISFCTGGNNIGNTSGGGPGPNHTAAWSAGYAQGTTVITLSSTTGLAVGSTIFIDQLDDTSDGYPASGDIYMCAGSQPCSWEGGNSFARDGRVQTELHRVTAINGSNVTISPGVYAPNFRSARSPGAWWGDTSVVVKSSGIEDMTIDFTASGGTGIAMINATDDWLRGLRAIFNGGPGSFVFHVLVVNGMNLTVRDSYFYGPTVVGTTQYAYAPHVTSGLLYENNILHHNVSPVAPNDPEVGSVYGYNYVDDGFFSTSGFQQHNGGDMLNLFEGNNVGTMASDSIHGTHFFLTYFRNHLDGHAHNPGGNSFDGGFAFWSHNRFHNLIGNVIGASSYTTYETNLVDSGQSIYNLGFAGSHGGTSLGDDSNVKRTLMRWGNWDSVTGTTRFLAAEVPSDIPNFANPVPASQALPASLYLSAKPAFFGNVPWPPIGPDVTGGNTSGSAGHAWKIPARVCFENTAIDTAYGSANIRRFDANACYGQPGQSIPAAPNNLAVR